MYVKYKYVCIREREYEYEYNQLRIICHLHVYKNQFWISVNVTPYLIEAKGMKFL